MSSSNSSDDNSDSSKASSSSQKSNSSVHSVEVSHEPINLRAHQPYIAGYARSNYSGCRECQEDIPKDSLRLGRLVADARYDGYTPIWFHFNCFFKKFQPRTTGDISNFTLMRYEDQKLIEQKVQNHSRRRQAPISSFLVEYARSGYSTCLWCDRNIPIGSVRIGRIDENSDTPLLIGTPIPRWFHINCFARCRQKIGFGSNRSAPEISGFEDLKRFDQQVLITKLPPLNENRRTSVKNEYGAEASSSESLSFSSDDYSSLEESLAAQSNLMYSYIDNLVKLKSSELNALLEDNGYDLSSMSDDRVDKIYALADAMAFGTLRSCPKCGDQVIFRIAGFICVNEVCDYTTSLPARSPFFVNNWLRNKYQFLEEYQYVRRDRVMPKTQYGCESYYPIRGTRFDPGEQLRLLLLGVRKKSRRRARRRSSYWSRRTS